MNEKSSSLTSMEELKNQIETDLNTRLEQAIEEIKSLQQEKDQLVDKNREIREEFNSRTQSL